MLDTISGDRDPWHTFEDEVDRVRLGFAELIGARPEQVALVPNASVGAYQAVSTIDMSTRRRIVTVDEEFPSLGHVWLAQRPRGAEVVYATDATDYPNLIDERTALVSVPLVTYREARVLPASAVAAAAHAHGARVLVDAYQAAGVVDIDVAELDCDYLVAGSMKYLLGLPGLAFLYARDLPAGDHEPALTGWFGRTDPFAFDPRRLDFPPTARRFETGTVAVPAVYAANAGLGLIAGLDPARVRQHISSLVALTAERLKGEHVLLAPEPSAQGAHLAFVEDDPGALAAFMAGRDIAVSPRGGLVRVSFHYYSDAHDVEALCAALHDFRTVRR
jgi:selenocysteine lyase/cysteine desulfurase